MNPFMIFPPSQFPIVAIIAGVLVYAALLLLMKGLTEQEILRFPKGRSIVALAKKLHLLR